MLWLCNVAIYVYSNYTTVAGRCATCTSMSDTHTCMCALTHVRTHRTCEPDCFIPQTPLMQSVPAHLQPLCSKVATEETSSSNGHTMQVIHYASHEHC